MRGRRWVPVALSLLVLSSCSGGDDLADFCTLAADRTEFTALFDGFDPRDVTAAIATFEAARDAQVALRNTAPDEVRPDIDTVVAYVDDLIAGLEETDPTDDQPEIYGALAPRVAEVTGASARLDAYVERSC